MTFSEAVGYISSLEKRGWRLGLDRMEEFALRAGLVDALGRGDSGPRFIHIGGTNGKGSVTANCQSLMVEQGHRTGAFFSPFVFDPRERVQIGRELIERERFAELTQQLRGPCESMTDTEFQGPTEFEFKTALGFAAWKQAQCDWVALEVGLGGRLDATNIVEPACSVIVSIGWDHVDILGHTLELIAGEKAGIIKPGRPVVLGRIAPGPRAVLEAVAREKGSPVWRFGHEIVLEGERLTLPGAVYEGLRPGIGGAMQGHNMALAVAAMHLAGAIRDPEAVPRGVAKAKIPGRFHRVEFEGLTYLLDGAHNPDAAAVLADGLRTAGLANLQLVTAMVRGKDAGGFYAHLGEFVSHAHVASIDYSRGRPSSELVEEVRPWMPATAYGTVAEAVRTAAKETAPGGTVLVAGSLYMLSEVGKLLGLTPVEA